MDLNIAIIFNNRVFQHCHYDTSLFFLLQCSEILLLLIYVDDIILTESSCSAIDKFISYLSIVFHMKDLGDFHFFLRVQVSQDSTSLTLSSQSISSPCSNNLVLKGQNLVPLPLLPKNFSTWWNPNILSYTLQLDGWHIIVLIFDPFWYCLCSKFCLSIYANTSSSSSYCG